MKSFNQYLKESTIQEVLPKYDQMYPVAKEEVSGLQVRKNIDNTDSISATLGNDYYIMKGIREIPIEGWNAKKWFVSMSDIKRSEQLAEKIRESGEITTLIMVIEDFDEPYILEGQHRMNALGFLNVKSFPALIVLDTSRLS